MIPSVVVSLILQYSVVSSAYIGLYELGGRFAPPISKVGGGGGEV